MTRDESAIIGILLFSLGTFILTGLLDGAGTARFIWEAGIFGTLGGAPQS